MVYSIVKVEFDSSLFIGLTSGLIRGLFAALTCTLECPPFWIWECAKPSSPLRWTTAPRASVTDGDTGLTRFPSLTSFLYMRAVVRYQKKAHKPPFLVLRGLCAHFIFR